MNEKYSKKNCIPILKFIVTALKKYLQCSPVKVSS